MRAGPGAGTSDGWRQGVTPGYTGRPNIEVAHCTVQLYTSSMLMKTHFHGEMYSSMFRVRTHIMFRNTDTWNRGTGRCWCSNSIWWSEMRERGMLNSFCIAIFWCSLQMGWSVVIVEAAGRVGGGDTLVQKAEAIEHYRNMRPVQARTWKGRGCPPTWKPEKCGNYEETGSFADLSAPACWWPGELGTTPTNVEILGFSFCFSIYNCRKYDNFVCSE